MINLPRYTISEKIHESGREGEGEKAATVIQQMIEAIERNGFATRSDFFADQLVNHGMLVTSDSRGGL